MPYEFLYNRFPEIAKRETRTITINDGLKFGLPLGEYAFLGMFCNKSGCDCRRVFLYVVYSNRNQAEAVCFPVYYQGIFLDGKVGNLV